MIEAGEKTLTLAKKRFKIGTNPEKHLERILAFYNKTYAFSSFYLQAHSCVWCAVVWDPIDIFLQIFHNYTYKIINVSL